MGRSPPVGRGVRPAAAADGEAVAEGVDGDDEREPGEDPPVVVRDERLAARHELEVGHLLRLVAEPGADGEEDEVPDAGAEDGEEREAPERHPREAGRDRDEPADHGDEAADERRDVAVAPEELLRALERGGLEEEPLAVAVEERAAELEAEPVVHARPGERAERAEEEGERGVRPRRMERELPAEREEARRQHHHLARERDERALDRHEEEHEREAPVRGERGDRFEVAGEGL